MRVDRHKSVQRDRGDSVWQGNQQDTSVTLNSFQHFS
jgi:hypothetical protein